MCGRFTQMTEVKKVAESFGISLNREYPFKPRYNIAPSQGVPVILKKRELTIEIMQWGLVPSWSKDPSIGQRMINARAETVSEKPSFRGPLKNGRCLIYTDGFYEWKKEGHVKQPYFVRMKSQKPFLLGGLSSHWAGSDGAEILSFTILTTTPNDLMAPIHNRMPVILKKSSALEWMDHSTYDKSRLLTLLNAFASDEMEAFPVATIVNSPAHDSPDCVRKLEKQL